MTVTAIVLLIINLNTASVQQLQSLPGIGPALARRIVDFREKNHGFKRVEELLAVPGISEKRWRAIRDKVEVTPGGGPDSPPRRGGEYH
jgi:competence protein ComEA